MHTTKRILHIAESFATGVLNFLIDLTKYQVEEYDVYILWGQRPLTPSNAETLFDERVKLIKCKAFKGAIKSITNPIAYIEANKWYNKIQPDFVHLHSTASGIIGRCSIPCDKTKIIYTPHGYSFLSNNGGRLRCSIVRTIEKKLAQRDCLTVTCGKGQYEVAKKLTKNCTYISNGIDTNILEPFVTEIKEIYEPIKICTSGRLYPQKNPRLFNEIAKLLPQMEFIWIGDGGLRDELTAKNIKVTGWLSREDALKITAMSDFFILTSLWEGLPLALLEAMYIKKVCLVSNVIGNKDVIISGRNGIICETAEDFANNILNLAKDINKRKSIAEEAHKDVAASYNMLEMAKSYSKIYNS